MPYALSHAYPKALCPWPDYFSVSFSRSVRDYGVTVTRTTRRIGNAPVAVPCANTAMS